MAEDKDAEEVEATTTPTAKLGMMQIIILVVLLAATQIGVAFLMDIIKPPAAMANDASTAEEEMQPPSEPAQYLPLDPALVVNFQHAGKGRFLQTSIQLMTRDTDVYEAAKIHAPAIRSALIMLFGGVDFDEVSTSEGKKALQEAARKTADDVLGELAGIKGIDALYLTSFVIQ